MEHSLIILAGGTSSRMKKSIAVEAISPKEISLANTSSKALITYGKQDRPVLDALLLNAQKAGYKNVVLVIGENSNAFRKYYTSVDSKQIFPDLHFHFARQSIPQGRLKPLGTADALLQAIQQYPELEKRNFTVCNSDNLYSAKALRFLLETPKNNAFISYDRDALLFASERIARFALVELNSEKKMLNIIEKPSEEHYESMKDSEGKLRVSMNIWKFNGGEILEHLIACPLHALRNEKELPTAVLRMISISKINVIGIPLREHVPDLTSKEDIRTFKNYLEN